MSVTFLENTGKTKKIVLTKTIQIQVPISNRRTLSDQHKFSET